MRRNTHPLGYLLRPAVRWCVRRGVKIQEFIEISKGVFLDEAAREVARQTEDSNTSKLSAMTGLQRREVTRIFHDGDSQPRNISLPAKVLSAWTADFVTATGRPRVLTYAGAQSEFARLVSSVSKDLNSYTVLKELERSGAIERTTKGLRLVQSGFPVHHDSERGYELYSEESLDLLQAIDANLTAKTPVHHQIRTEYDNIPAPELPKIRAWIFEQGRQFHARIRAYLMKHDRDLASGNQKAGARSRVVLSSFAFSELLEKEEKQ